jgi:hypothetical protein
MMSIRMARCRWPISTEPRRSPGAPARTPAIMVASGPVSAAAAMLPPCSWMSRRR